MPDRPAACGARSKGCPFPDRPRAFRRKRSAPFPGRPCGQRQVLLVSSSSVFRWLVFRWRGLRLLLATAAAPAPCRRSGIVSLIGQCGGFAQRGGGDIRDAQTKPKNLSQHCRSRHPAEAISDGHGGLALAPQLPQQRDAFGRPRLACHLNQLHSAAGAFARAASIREVF